MLIQIFCSPWLGAQAPVSAIYQLHSILGPTLFCEMQRISSVPHRNTARSIWNNKWELINPVTPQINDQTDFLPRPQSLHPLASRYASWHWTSSTVDPDRKFTRRHASSWINSSFPPTDITQEKNAMRELPKEQTELSISLWPEKKSGESSFLQTNKYNSPPFPSNSSQNYVFSFCNKSGDSWVHWGFCWGLELPKQ